MGLRSIHYFLLLLDLPRNQFVQFFLNLQQLLSLCSQLPLVFLNRIVLQYVDSELLQYSEEYSAFVFLTCLCQLASNPSRLCTLRLYFREIDKHSEHEFQQIFKQKRIRGKIVQCGVIIPQKFDHLDHLRKIGEKLFDFLADYQRHTPSLQRL